jgi:hypothetical protein
LGREARLRDRRRSVGKRVREISAARMRGRQALATLDRLTAEIAKRAEQTVRDAHALAKSAHRQARRRRASVALVEQLERELEAASRCSHRPISAWPGSGRSRPARSQGASAAPGNPVRPTEFGYKARVADPKEGFVILDVPAPRQPDRRWPARGAIVKAKTAGMHVRTVYADRGFGTSRADAALAPKDPRRRHSALARRRSDRAPPQLEAPLSLPQRARGPDLTAEAQEATPHALAYARGHAVLAWRHRPRPQPPQDGAPDVTGQ